MEQVDLAPSRRTVLGALGASAFVAACGSGTGAEPQPQQRAAAAAEKLKRGGLADWSRMTGTEFDAAGFRLRVAGVRPLQSGGERPAVLPRQEAFLVAFDLTAGADMPGDLIYALTAPGHAPLDVFLAAAGEAGKMHAVFN